MKVLYSDSDVRTREYVSMLLEGGLDCEILQSSSGNEAITILELEAEIDFIISEVQMHGGGAKELIEYLENNRLDIPIVWLSDSKNKTNSFVEKSFSLNHLSAFVSKPFKDNEFFPVLDQLLSNLPLKEKKEETVSKTANTQEQENIKNEFKIEDHSKDKQQEVEADWSLHGKKKNSQEVEADWDVSVKSKPQSSEEADWSLKPKHGKTSDEEFADWGLKKGKSSEEVEADWDLKNKSSSSEEVDADWDLKNQSSGNEEVDAEWDLKNKNSSGQEVEADWDLKNQSSSSEEVEDFEGFSTKWNLQSEQREFDSDKYYSVKIKRFLPLEKTPCDIFLQLSLHKYVRIFNSEQGLDKQILEKYITKKVEHLLVLKEDYQKLLDLFSEKIFSKLSHASELGGDVKIVAELAAYKNIIEKSKEFGVTQATAKSIERAIESNLKEFSGQKALSDLLQKMLRGQDYLTEHSLMISYVAGQICLGTSWSNSLSLQKLSMAALLHDTMLNNTLAKLHDLNPERVNSLSKELKDEVLDHPKKTSELISKGVKVFPDVESIILNHHENVDKTGYPSQLGALSIAPMSCIFIMAHDYVNHFYSVSADKHSIEEIKGFFEVKYSKGNFKKPLEAFIKMF